MITISTATRINPKSQNGIIILQIGNYHTASARVDEWLFWKAGIAYYVVMQRNESSLITLLIVGYVVILLLSYYNIRKKNKDRKQLLVTWLNRK